MSEVSVASSEHGALLEPVLVATMLSWLLPGELITAVLAELGSVLPFNVPPLVHDQLPTDGAVANVAPPDEDPASPPEDVEASGVVPPLDEPPLLLLLPPLLEPEPLAGGCVVP